MQTKILLTAIHAGLSHELVIHLKASERFTDDLLSFSSSQLQKLGFTTAQAERFVAVDSVAADLDWLMQADHHLVSVFDDDYPLLLKEIPGPPIALYVLGARDLLGEMQLAMVGSRNPSPAGKQTAYDFAKHLATMGLTITSGLATGIDAAAHQGALEAGGMTIAVCGTGLDVVYPARHRELAANIAQQGALLSEFPIGTKPKPYHFPRRNRIIAGLSIGTLVVEAAIKSGSLITARLASEQGREVFAVPGSIHNPLARGCHRLIRQGAKLVETAEDIIEELGQLAGVEFSSPEAALEIIESDPILDADYQKLLAVVDYETTAVDVIVMRSQLPADQVASMLLILELNSYVKKSVGGYVRLK